MHASAGSPWAAMFALILPLALSVAAERPCASVSANGRGVWSSGGVGQFQFRVVVGKWQPYERVILEFNKLVSVQNVYDGTLIMDLTTPSSITVELGPVPTATHEFAVMGSMRADATAAAMDSSSQIDLDAVAITCSPIAGPPPMPPHPDDCPLLAEYRIKNAWAGGEV